MRTYAHPAKKSLADGEVSRRSARSQLLGELRGLGYDEQQKRLAPPGPVQSAPEPKALPGLLATDGLIGDPLELPAFSKPLPLLEGMMATSSKEIPLPGVAVGSKKGAATPDELAAGTVKLEKPPTWPKHYGGVLPPWASGGGSYVPPTISFSTEGGEPGEGGVETHVVRFQPTTCKDATHPAWATPAGKHAIRQIVDQGVRVFLWVRVSDDVSATIATAEKEHLSDLDRAFELVFGVVRDSINELAADQTPFSGVTVAEAKKKALDELRSMVGEKVGTSKEEWVAAYENLGILTLTLRDQAGLHTVETVEDGEPVYHKEYGTGERFFKAVSKITLKDTKDVISWSNVK